ncbi:MAG: hypothetical protein L0216_19605 [Planctomycetales bacterium]|nr:hypothetical protein [Planctomycetales bacterium]
MAPLNPGDGLDRAVRASRACGWLAAVYSPLALAAAWLSVPGPASLGDGPGTEWADARWTLAPGVSLAIPFPAALVALTLPPVLALGAATLVIRRASRDPGRLPGALLLGAAASGLGIVPGLFVSLERHWRSARSSADISSSGLTGLPLLLLSAAFLWTWFRHAGVLRGQESGPTGAC